MADNAPPTTEYWFNIWAAGIEISTMCLQYGFTGRVDDLGEFFRIACRICASNVFRGTSQVCPY